MSFQMKLNLWLTKGFFPAGLVLGESPQKQKARRFGRALRQVRQTAMFSSGRLFFDDGFLLCVRLRTAPRTFGKSGLDLLDRLGLGQPLNRRYLSG